MNNSDSDYWRDKYIHTYIHLSSRVVDMFAHLISGDITTRILVVSDRPRHLYLSRPLLCAQRGQKRTNEDSCFLFLSVVHDHELHVGCLGVYGLRRLLVICTLFCCKCAVIYVCIPVGTVKYFIVYDHWDPPSTIRTSQTKEGLKWMWAVWWLCS